MQCNKKYISMNKQFVHINSLTHKDTTVYVQHYKCVPDCLIHSSRHTVVCRAAQEAVVPPVSILTGRKKTQFSDLCSSVIPYPIGTKFAREVPASKGSLHTKFEENRSSHFRDTSEQNFVLISSFFFFYFFISHTSQNPP